MLFQATIDGLEDEIAAMEAQLARSKEYLETSSAERKALFDKVQAVSLHTDLSCKVQELQQQAQAVSRKFASTKGLHNWQPVKLSEIELSFLVLGPSPQSSIEVSFQRSNKGMVCAARVDPHIFLEARPRMSTRFRSVSTFLETRTASLNRKIASLAIASPVQVGECLQFIELQLGRLEQTAAELTMLHRRYNAMLTPSQVSNSSSFQVEVDFTVRSKQHTTAKLCASFELSEAYPFAPLNVRLDTIEGEVDVDELRKLLIKNAKPGFGYLSRICDVITAFLR